ncbi:SRPBCC family protein [Streptomyces sp. NPDC002067]
MRIGSSVPVAGEPAAVFALLNDVRRVASCMPGAVLDGPDGADGDAWRGRVTVRVGPVAAAYGGTVRFLESDAGRRRLRLQARGADRHGRGDAEAEVVLTVTGDPAGARLDVATDLVISGKLAQFGKGALDAVAQRLLQRFAVNLGELLAAERTGGAGAEEEAAGPAGASGPGAGPSGSGVGPTGTGADLPGSGASLPGSGTSLSDSGADRAAPANTAQHTGGPVAAGPAPVAAGPAPAPVANGPALPAGPPATRYGPLVAAFAFGVFEGWLLTRFGQLRREVARARRG